ncbi:PadR family transcriptional regulator [Cellulomonas xylanilytica]|uniref:PadR family transcriptional regulator n=1 Tax=Cellulomonas xylanilytica TaxID=233583 RepID=A0A510V1J8_9CELL|nr:PadR family transcriptional regulator [Cellulomonas xylanilytica]GEK20728.1 PadR family transcriptional regulator [Cellulomonas xylanilytica]
MPGPATPQGSSTRLLVLGCVRIFQPVHGYFLRRELVSWEVDQWAHVHPGSIYNALKSLTRSGLLEEVGVVADGPRPQRTTYRLTDAGEDEFLALLRAGLLSVDDPTFFLTAVNMAFALPRDEVVRTLETRVEVLEEYLRVLAAQIQQILGEKDTPDTATEVARLISARTRGELEWARDFLDRVRAGAYAFQGEPPLWTPTPEQIEVARLAGVGPGVVAAHDVDT